MLVSHIGLVDSIFVILVCMCIHLIIDAATTVDIACDDKLEVYLDGQKISPLPNYDVCNTIKTLQIPEGKCTILLQVYILNEDMLISFLLVAPY